MRPTAIIAGLLHGLVLFGLVLCPLHHKLNAHFDEAHAISRVMKESEKASAHALGTIAAGAPCERAQTASRRMPYRLNPPGAAWPPTARAGVLLL